ncbi:MAG: DUF3267 domain-containing protein [Ignavibacteriales bacterium]|nr:DUF3267 domain-containing protein [Ignavibacteriales bacterium]
MIFRLGPLPEVPEFTPDDSWILVREPTVGGFQLRAIPIALVTTVSLAVLWTLFTPIWHEIGPQTFPLPIFKFVGCLLGVIVIHEFIHASVHPKIGISENTVIGFWPSRMFIYTTYVGELTKNRCLAILIMPFTIISVVPLVFATITQTASFWVAYVSILNGLLACGDILAAIMTMRLFPNGAIVRTKGWLTFWRPRE